MAYLKWHLEHEHAIEAGKIVFAFVTLGVAVYTVKPSVRSAELAEWTAKEFLEFCEAAGEFGF